MFRSIVVGTDGSESSFSAVRQAAELAAQAGAQLHVACCVKDSYDLAGAAGMIATAPPGWLAELNTAGEDSLNRAIASVGDLDAAPQPHLLKGEPARALTELCEAVGADLLVVGNRGMNGVGRFVLGSVPNRCAHHAPCSVLIAHTTG